MTSRIIPADQMSGADFFSLVTGRPRKTKEQREAEWRADIERYADAIERGGEWAVPPPCLHDARKLVEERAQLTQVQSDPLAHLEPKRDAA